MQLSFVDISEKGKIHTFLNPYSYLLLRNNTELLRAFDNVLVDGQLMVRFLSIFGIANVQRKSFDMTSLAPIVFGNAELTREKVFLVGTTPDAIEVAVVKLKHEYPKLNIVGYHHGYLDKEEDAKDVINSINSLAANTVIVGMGAPRQERFLLKLKKTGWQGTGFTCGGFFHQTSTKINYYPKWIDKFNLRWAYRIYDEPKLFTRYFILYPWAICLMILDFKIKKNK
ncbi:UDP-Gal:alpha-D-GlcNAc-diphosphoundecaprenol beta-1,4-galactosyltransferase [Paraglaciecola mesophila]|uniref:UDP-Gal:alpha-D-GlcNAc-diphosphoundecaprenol beta-1,4-galactosyltransferase n=1 Tax=Paraglaciecola mesophila TaxID=197222 RepID=A0A857JJT7_9ALTE|nr:WecB/TagA/CpsF family glycosyltransferase [Paraglaciecola mesophila]QHJ11400.1 UDP-Gal:alpha-D-GlcNAc-diphosphoundecaprenol beta-1,4-galactosyltransferase [Paraglaciecola mesophila]